MASIIWRARHQNHATLSALAWFRQRSCSLSSKTQLLYCYGKSCYSSETVLCNRFHCQPECRDTRTQWHSTICVLWKVWGTEYYNRRRGLIAKFDTLCSENDVNEYKPPFKLAIHFPRWYTKRQTIFLYISHKERQLLVNIKMLLGYYLFLCKRKFSLTLPATSCSLVQ